MDCLHITFMRDEHDILRNSDILKQDGSHFIYLYPYSVVRNTNNYTLSKC